MKMKKKKKKFFQCDRRTDCQTVIGDEKKMKSPGEGRGEDSKMILL